MEFLVGILLFFFIAVTIVVNVLYRQAVKNVNNRLFVKPNLGIQEIEHNGLKNAVIQWTARLENSFPEQYIDKVKERVLREQKISLTEWDNRWFEWKRYFLLYLLAPDLPMPSREIDVIWHEMEKFEKEYQEFCERFVGCQISRPEKPSTKKTAPHERAKFDLFYITLFQPTPFSQIVWGQFLKNALSQTMVSDWLNGTKEELIGKYFSEDRMERIPALQTIGEYLIEKIQEQFDLVDQHIQKFAGDLNKFRYNRKLQPYDRDPSLNMLTGVIFLSMVHQERFPEMYYLLYVRSQSEGGDQYRGVVRQEEKSF